jgi:16S rRNA processing protein RimM
MTKTICLGEIVAAHGIKGHVKIKTYTTNPESLQLYKTLTDAKGRYFKVSNVRASSPHSVIAFVQGITTRNQAEELRGTHLYITRDQLPQTAHDEFYHEDLIGLRINDSEGTCYGSILGVQNFGAGEFFDIKADNKIITLPFNKDAVIDISIETGIMIINPEFLLV